METIPLRPVFENKLFQDSKPIIKYAVLNAVYLLCKQHKANQPIPAYLEPYLGLCNAGYYRNKKVCSDILTVVMPQIVKIKQPVVLRMERIRNGKTKKAIENKRKNSENIQFSDESEIKKIEITPIPPDYSKRTYHQGHSDHVEVRKAKESKDTGKEKWFKDK